MPGAGGRRCRGGAECEEGEVLSAVPSWEASAGIRIKLGGYGLQEPSRQWTSSVSGASVTRFVARAQGHAETDAEGITVTLGYHVGQPVGWAVQRRRDLPLTSVPLPTFGR